MAPTEISPGPARLRSAARLGRTAWLFGNLYEAAVGMPELLGLAQGQRSPGLTRVGSPVRYFAPVALLAIGASAADLVTAWRADRGDRMLIGISAGSLTAALGLSGYLIGTVNVPLLGADDLGPVERRRLTSLWYRVNAARLAALAVAIGSERLRSRRR